jgi:hypothetical protein
LSIRKILLFFCLVASVNSLFAQHATSLNVKLNDDLHQLEIQQELTFVNTSADSLSEIYLLDWANSFSDKTTPLGKRFSEDYLRRFYFAKPEERGHTTIHKLTNSRSQDLVWERPKDKQDIIKVTLPTPLAPNASFEFKLTYTVKIPDEKFTRYGFYENGDLKLRYWYIRPSVYTTEWKAYSHKNLDDQFVPKSNITITIEVANDKVVTSSLNTSERVDGDKKIVTLTGNNRIENKLYITSENTFDKIITDYTSIETNIDDDDLPEEAKALAVDRILSYLDTELGSYPHEKILVTNEDYLANPVYGLNQLPDFINPFPDGFQYEIKLLKTITNNYLENTLLLNPREEKWVHDGIHIKILMDYVDRYYPKMKLLGSLSDFFGIRWFHAAELEFNDQYPYLFMNMARMNLDQALTTPTDSLVKFNQNIANAYKSGTGFEYLEDYLGTEEVKITMKEFYQNFKLKEVSSTDFMTLLQKNASKDLSWYFDDYVGTNKKIDFRIKRVKKTKDSLTVTIKNKRNAKMPVSLYGIKDGRVITKDWVEPFLGTQTVTIPRDSSERVALNYEGIIPEFNQRDNYKSVSKLTAKPIQFRLLQDIEDPKYAQTFFIPEFDYNIYDGVAIGLKMYNKAVLSKNLAYKISPKYGFGSNTIVGSASIYNTHYFDNSNLNAVRYGVGGTTFSYANDLFYRKYTPYLTFYFRDTYLRNNEKQRLNFRYVAVERDRDQLNVVDEPDYGVFNARYIYSNPNLVNYFSGYVDYQLSDSFSKISASATYRKLFLNNRQLNLRVFAGAFLYNDNTNSDYFSFALDRPTDYLFDYNYYGRSEESGLFSQQIIPAEGFFKSKLEPAFANQWMTTLNGSTNIWKWIFAYGDAGLIKNRGSNPKFVYDTGVRASLVADYFEIFFPVYSNNGWEIAQDNYDEKIRFIVTLDIQTLIKLFTREWY